ncbi:MAG: heme exporter protein CcmD [Gammaproteobacteria bacterium]|nr:heme exporter protein CcmD [Gammaproteobacteria bacterium]
MVEWLDMGGYAAYVWPVFSVAFFLVIGIALTPRIRHKRIFEELKMDKEAASED